MHWVQSPRNSHFTVSTLTIPHTFHGEPLPFSHSLFLWAKFNWLAWSGIWLLLTFRSVNGTELCCSSAIYPWGHCGFESNPAGGHNPQIPCNMCFTSPCGWTYDCRTLHTLTLLCVCCVTQHVAGGIYLSIPNAGMEDSSEVYTQLLRSLFKQWWASSREGLHGKSKPPPTGGAVSSKGSQTEF